MRYQVILTKRDMAGLTVSAPFFVDAANFIDAYNVARHRIIGMEDVDDGPIYEIISIEALDYAPDFLAKEDGRTIWATE